MSPQAASQTITRTGIRIGSAWTPRPNHVQSLDAHKVQSAFLEPRTARPMHWVRKVIAPVIRWL